VFVVDVWSWRRRAQTTVMMCENFARERRAEGQSKAEGAFQPGNTYCVNQSRQSPVNSQSSGDSTGRER